MISLPMFSELDAGALVRLARTRGGLTQRELAGLAGTSQPAVARIERGQTSPSAATLRRLLEAAGFELEVELRSKPVVATHMLDDVSRILRLSPADRLREVANLSRFEAAVQRV